MKNGIIKGFKHVIGKHCESASMRDVLEYIGLPYSEPMVFGLDATFGFSFMKAQNVNALPFFVGGKQNTITKESLACRVLGVAITEEQFQSAERCWERSKDLLQQNIPLLIRIEMAYLPYEDFPEGEFFGGHIMSLVGFNEESAYLIESNLKDPIKLPIEILKKARSSKEDPWFPPKNTHYILQKKPKRPPFSAACKLAIQRNVKNMLAASTNFHGLPGMKSFAKSISSWKETLQGNLQRGKKKMSKAMITLQLMYGYIEEFGTGGALFRNMFGDFLADVISHQKVGSGNRPWKPEEILLVEEQIPLIRESAENWTEFAMSIKRAVGDGKEDCLDFMNLEELENIVWKSYDLEEIAFQNLNKIRI